MTAKSSRVVVAFGAAAGLLVSVFGAALPAHADGVPVSDWSELVAAIPGGSAELTGSFAQTGTLAVPAGTVFTLDLHGETLTITGPGVLAPAVDASAAGSEFVVIDTVGGGDLIAIGAAGNAGGSGSTFDAPGFLELADLSDLVGAAGGPGSQGGPGGTAIAGTVHVVGGAVTASGGMGGAGGAGGKGEGWLPALDGGAGASGGPGGTAVDGDVVVSDGEFRAVGGAGGAGGRGGLPGGAIVGYQDFGDGPELAWSPLGGYAGFGGTGGAGGIAVAGDLDVDNGAAQVFGGAGGTGGGGNKGGIGGRFSCIFFGFIDDDGTPLVDPNPCHYWGHDGSRGGDGGAGAPGLLGDAALTGGSAGLAGGAGGASGFGGEYGTYPGAGPFDAFPTRGADGGPSGDAGSGGAGAIGGIQITGGDHGIAGGAGGVAAHGGAGESGGTSPGSPGRIGASGDGGAGIAGPLGLLLGALTLQGGDAGAATIGSTDWNWTDSSGGHAAVGAVEIAGGTLVATSGVGNPTLSAPSSPDGSTLVAGAAIPVAGVRTVGSNPEAGGDLGSAFADDAGSGAFYTATVTTASAGGVKVRARLELSFSYPVAFDTGGGSEITDVIVPGGDVLPPPADPMRMGYAFTGWHTGSASGPGWDPTTVITVPLVLYASWALVPVGIGVSVSDSTPDQGDTIVVTAVELDILGGDMADVSDQIVITSDNPLDIIVGNRVTFPHASPHVLTITHGALQSTVTIQVTPLPGALARTGPSVTAANALLAVAVLGVGGLMVMSSRGRRGDGRRPRRVFS